MGPGGFRGVRVGEASHPGPEGPRNPPECRLSLSAVCGTPLPCAVCGRMCSRGTLAGVCEACGLTVCLSCRRAPQPCVAAAGDHPGRLRAAALSADLSASTRPSDFGQPPPGPAPAAGGAASPSSATQGPRASQDTPGVVGTGSDALPAVPAAARQQDAAMAAGADAVPAPPPAPPPVEGPAGAAVLCRPVKRSVAHGGHLRALRERGRSSPRRAPQHPRWQPVQGHLVLPHMLGAFTVRSRPLRPWRGAP